MKRAFGQYLTLLVLLLSLNACTEYPDPQPESSAAEETTAPVTETMEAPTEPSGPVLLDNATDGMVCVSFLPTREGQWRYVELPDQGMAVAAFEQATGAVYSDEWWIKGDKTIGLTVVYKGTFWDFVESGELVCAIGRVKAEDAADLLALCTDAAGDAGWSHGVSPEQLRNIVSANLYQGETRISLTDPQKLSCLEQLLTSGKFALGGTGCPFGVVLEVQTQSGDSFTLRLAADGCGVWMSEGLYYDFASDSQPLFDLFDAGLSSGSLAIK